MSVATAYFDQLFVDSDDPWAFRQRWYEQRKRALTLGLLTKPRYASIFEPGCANGELSAELAPRCARLLCCDTAAAAVSLAQARLQGFAHAHQYHVADNARGFGVGLQGAFGYPELPDNFGSGEIAVKALAGGGTKSAIQRAAHLGGNAQGSAIIFGDKHGFNRIAIG